MERGREGSAGVDERERVREEMREKGMEGNREREGNGGREGGEGREGREEGGEERGTRM